MALPKEPRAANLRPVLLPGRRSPRGRPLEILSLAFAAVAAAAVIAATGRMEAVVNLLSHKWIHLTDGAMVLPWALLSVFFGANDVM